MQTTNSIAKCQHIKTNGIRCGSPSLRARRFCYFHHRMHDLRRLRLENPNARYNLPLLEDANSIQMAIQDVADAVAEDRIEMKRAGLLLFALQTAAGNLKHTDLEPRQLRENDPEECSELTRLLLEQLEIGPYAKKELQPALTESASSQFAG